jgi:16S rRNA (uracil1498-N3)-methyltransferase
MANRFYVNCELRPGEIVLQGAEARHLASVRRLDRGDRICLFNGNGRQYPAIVVEVSPQCVVAHVDVEESPSRELPFALHVAAPLPKGDRAQFLIEKLTEIGSTRYTPLHTERSVIHPGAGRLEKLHRYVIETSKQCGRNVLMEIGEPIAWTAYCSDARLPPDRFLADPNGEPPKPLFRGDAALAVGPEGGFTAQELEVAKEHNWQLVTLGPRILRIETAAMVLAAIAVSDVGPGA